MWFFQNVGIPAPYIIISLPICLLLIIAFDCIVVMFAVATISSTLCTNESYLYLHDLCVCVFWCILLCIFICIFMCMGQVPEIKLMMMMIIFLGPPFQASCRLSSAPWRMYLKHQPRRTCTTAALGRLRWRENRPLQHRRSTLRRTDAINSHKKVKNN